VRIVRGLFAGAISIRDKVDFRRLFKARVAGHVFDGELAVQNPPASKPHRDGEFGAFGATATIQS
jgi:hypothetical protein